MSIAIIRVGTLVLVVILTVESLGHASHGPHPAGLLAVPVNARPLDHTPDREFGSDAQARTTVAVSGVTGDFTAVQARDWS